MTTTVAQLQGIVEVDTSQAIANLSQFNTAMEAGKTGLSSLNDALTAVGLGVSLAGLAAEAINVGKAIVDLGMGMEQTKMGFTTLLHSADDATAMLENLRQFAMKTPFQFLDLIDASKRMLALGFAAKDVIPTLTAVGDASSALGLGAAGIDRITYALGQVRSTGKLTGMEVREMAMAGVPVWKYLAEAINGTTEQAQELSAKGLIPAQKAIDAITAGMEKDFGGMMANQMQTAAGAASNLVDKLQKIGTEIGTDLLPEIKGLINGLATAAEAFDTLYNWNRSISSALAEHNTQVMLTSKSYEDYVNEMVRANVAAGKIDQSTADQIKTMLAQRDAYQANSAEIQALGDQYGKLTPTQQMQLVLDGKITEDQLHLLGTYRETKQALDDSISSLGLATNAGYDAARATDAVSKAQTQATGNARAYGAEVNALQVQYAAAKAREDAFANAVMTSDDKLKILKEDMAGAVGKENQSYLDSQGKLTKSAQDLQDQYDKLAKTQGMHYGPSDQQLQAASDALDQQATLTDKLAKAEFDVGPATEKLAKAQEALAKNTDPKKAEALQGAYLAAKVGLDNAKGSVDSMNDSIGKNNAAIAAASGGVIDHTAKLKDLQGQLQTVDAELATNAAAHDRKTKQVIFDMLEEEITRRNTMDGEKTMSDQQIEGLQKLAVQWGLVDKSTADANTSIINAVGEAAKSGNWNELWGDQTTTSGYMDDIVSNAEGLAIGGVTSLSTFANSKGWQAAEASAMATRDRLTEVYSAAIRIPSDVTLNVHFNIDQSGFAQVKDLAAYSGNPNLPANNPNMTHIPTSTAPAPAPAKTPDRKKAGGGPVVPNSGGYWVGEEGPEWFEPTVAGTIIPNKESGGGGRPIYASFYYQGQQLDEQAIVAALNRLSYVYG